MLSTEERTRLRGLLERFDLLPYEELILAQAAPCIAMNLEDPPGTRPQSWPAAPLGASKVGGLPDLPASVDWPVRDGFRAGFFLQIALADLPRVSWSPWPTEGMVYLFCHDYEGHVASAPGWELLYYNGPPQALRRGVCPGEPLRVDTSFFLASDPRRIIFASGTDFPPGSQGDWSAFVNPLDAAGRARNDGGVLDRYFEFKTLAADPDVEANQAKGLGPYFFPVGCLFGHTDRSLMKNQNAPWRQLMRLESNPATEFMSPYDAAPVYIMAPDPGTRPWLPHGLVYGLCAK
jgi:hypothetical protein